MTDKPIIFSTAMVRALLDGRKTQTRRVLDPQPESAPNNFVDVPATIAIGDRLWVREAFWLCEECGHRNMCADGANYSGFPDRWCCVSCDALLPTAKTSPIFMPREASRLTLIVSDVRLRRLQDISTKDCIAEGVSVNPREAMEAAGESELARRHAYHDAHVAGFRDLWTGIHGAGAWDANPWVEASIFTIVKGNIDEIGGAQ